MVTLVTTVYLLVNATKKIQVIRLYLRISISGTYKAELPKRSAVDLTLNGGRNGRMLPNQSEYDADTLVITSGCYHCVKPRIVFAKYKNLNIIIELNIRIINLSLIMI